MKLLIIRGWGSKKEHWQETLDILKKNNIDILLPDLPGVSDESGIKEPWSIKDYKNWILKYVGKKGWGKFNLLGHSFGGAIAAKLAADKPDKVKKLILCAPAVAGTKSLRTILFYLTAQITKTIFLLPLLKKRFSKVKYKLSSWGIRDYYFEGGVRKKILKRAAKENHKESLQKIKTKTLVLWGAEDDRIPCKHAKEVKDAITNSKIIVFSKINHSPHWENPKDFTKEIIKFII